MLFIKSKTAGALAILAAAMIVGHTGSAAAAGPAANDSGPMLDAAAATYRSVYPQMSASAAARAAAQQQARKSLYDTLAADGGDRFGGAWFDAPSGVLHFATTTSQAAALVAARGRELDLRVETTIVPRSFTELERLADQLRAGSDPIATAANGQVGIDVKTNRVVAAVPAAQRAALVRAGVPAGVTLIADPGAVGEPDACTSRALCDTTLRAGPQLWRTNVGSTVCSAGFTGRVTGTDARIAFTAGHCSNGFATWGTGANSIGQLWSSMDSGAIDAAYIPVLTAGYLDDIPGQDRGGQIFRDPLYGGTVNVDGAAPTLSYIWVDDVVCLSANYTDVNGPNYCGVVTTNSDPTNRGLARVEGLDGCNGDSGGGWYWLAGSTRTAFGLHSRSDDGCHGDAGGTGSWFSPVPTIKAGFAPGTDIELR
jgi:streptogrisin C